MDIQLYLERINFQKQLKANKETLFELQKMHLLNIPFENLDIHYNRKISLEINGLYKKIVGNKRGGFCYELNGLFFQLLQEIGFDAKLISARVYIKDGRFSPEYDHLAILVNLDNQTFLTDVGFGKFSLEPLKFNIGETITDYFGQFQFSRLDAKYFQISEIRGNYLIPQYIFEIKKRQLSEFEKRCNYHQISKGSHFTQKKVISIVKDNGRITLNNQQLKITREGIEEEIKFEEKDFEKYLKKYFNMDI